MNTDDAKRIVTKLRRWTYWRDVSQSDLELLRSQADAYENVSFILVIMWCGTRHNLASWSWWDLGLIGVLAFIVYCRLQMAKLRKAIRLFEDEGPQMIDELEKVTPPNPSARTTA